MFKYVPLFTSLALLGACSHHTVKKSSHPYKLSRSWLDNIKTKKPGKLKADRRFPASSNIPGLKPFMTALKAHPDALKAPVGQEVLKSGYSIYEGQEYHHEEKIVYLKENRHGHFTLSTSSEDGGDSFDIIDSESIHDIEQTLIDQGNVKEIKKLSETQFKITFKVDPYFEKCEVEIDLKKSVNLTNTVCYDLKGKVVSEDKVISIKQVNLQDYKEKLTSIKANVISNVRECDYSSQEETENCFDTITDESERDWSYILK